MSIVYIKKDSNNVITNINSSDFLTDISDWIGIDEGIGDKYSHAQSQYLAKGICDGLGRFNYKYDNNVVTVLTESEKASLFGKRTETIASIGSDYGEVGTWSDGNPDNEDRLYRFVTIVGDQREISIANSTSQIVGTSNLMQNVGFLGNYTSGSESDNSKVIVSILGISYVKTNDSSIVANDRVMSDDNGYAVKSSNNLGYRVLGRTEDDLLEIVVSPNTDMIQRIKTDMFKYVVGTEEPTAETCPEGYFYFKISE